MNTLILRRNDYNVFHSWRFYLVIAAFLAIVGVILLIPMLTINDFDVYAAFQKLISTNLFSITFAVVFVYFYRKWLNITCIELSENGIKYVSGISYLKGKYDKNWRLSWDEIQSVSLIESAQHPNPDSKYFLIRANDDEYKIYPTCWSDPNRAPISSTFVEKLFNNRKYIDKKIKQSPLFEFFQRKEVMRSGTDILKLKSDWTDINTSPMAQTMAGVLIFSLTYFIIETYFTLSEYYAEEAPYFWFVGVGILSGLASVLVLKSSKLKPIEIGIMSVLVGFGIGMTSYPLMLRINEWTDKEGLQTYSYTLIEGGRWISENIDVDEQLPNLIFDLAYSDYWKKFDINTTKNFELRKGGLGFYQINMKPIYEEQRVYYKAKNEPNNNHEK